MSAADWTALFVYVGEGAAVIIDFVKFGPALGPRSDPSSACVPPGLAHCNANHHTRHSLPREHSKGRRFALVAHTFTPTHASDVLFVARAPDPRVPVACLHRGAGVFGFSISEKLDTTFSSFF